MSRPLLLALLLLAVPAAAAGQQLATAVHPDTVRVGDVFRAAVRVDLPPGWRAALPDSLPIQGDLENAGARTETVETRADGGQRVTVVYPVTAWQTGAAALPEVPVRVQGPEGERKLRARLPQAVVRSVLPADTAGVEPRPPKDVIGANRVLWPYLLALALLAVVAAAAYVLWRRRRLRAAAVVEPEPPVPPRERALAELDEARGAGLVEAGEYKAFYTRITGAVRGYLEALEPGWGAELATSELLPRIERATDAGAAGELARLLGAADLVKFARRIPAPDEALADWAAARRWVESFDGPPPPEPVAAGASDAEALDADGGAPPGPAAEGASGHGEAAGGGATETGDAREVR